MTWKAYRLIYKLESPIHIGWGTLGYIKLTRRYITGMAMWGAATAVTTRMFGDFGTSSYSKFAEFFKENARLSYFFPSCEKDKPLMPRFSNRGLAYTKEDSVTISKEAFEKMFIDSYAQTAVLPTDNSAEDESLHESEYIVPFVSAKQLTPVYFCGWLFLKEGDALEEILPSDSKKNLINALSELSVGADLKYGWGRLSLVNNPLEEKEADQIFGFSFSKDKVKEGPEIHIPAENAIFAHSPMKTVKNIKGNVEPLVGRQWGQSAQKARGAGQKIFQGGLCWVPGSIVTEKKGLGLQVGPMGILVGKPKGGTNE